MKNSLYKFKHQIKRYGPGELLGTVGAMIFWYIWFSMSWNQIVGSYSGARWENLWYYGYNIFQEYKEQKKLGKQWWSIIKDTLKDVITEYGFSEILDSFFIRPGAMYLASQFISNFAIALFVGKIVADCIFYIPTILLYQKTLRRDINQLLDKIEDKLK